jgi:hypothetical protein
MALLGGGQHHHRTATTLPAQAQPDGQSAATRSSAGIPVRSTVTPTTTRHPRLRRDSNRTLFIASVHTTTGLVNAVVTRFKSFQCPDAFVARQRSTLQPSSKR